MRIFFISQESRVHKAMLWQSRTIDTSLCSTILIMLLDENISYCLWKHFQHFKVSQLWIIIKHFVIKFDVRTSIITCVWSHVSSVSAVSKISFLGPLPCKGPGNEIASEGNVQSTEIPKFKSGRAKIFLSIDLLKTYCREITSYLCQKWKKKLVVFIENKNGNHSIN